MATATYVKRREKGDNRQLFVSDKYITKILRDKNNKDYVLYTLKAIFDKAELFPIEDYEYVDVKIAKKSDVVDSIADVVLENDKVIVNIEINTSKSKSAQNKNFSYTCWLILRQLPTGTSHTGYKNIKPIIQVNLNTFDQFSKGELMYVSKLMDVKYHLVTSNLLIIIDLSMDILDKMDYNV